MHILGLGVFVLFAFLLFACFFTASFRDPRNADKTWDRELTVSLVGMVVGLLLILV